MRSPGPSAQDEGRRVVDLWSRARDSWALSAHRLAAGRRFDLPVGHVALDIVRKWTGLLQRGLCLSLAKISQDQIEWTRFIPDLCE
jgi:hypothetical protein